MKLSKGSIIGISAASVFVALAVLFFSMFVSYSNREIGLRNQTLAQQETCKAFYDKLWKVISQKADVASEYRKAFSEIYSQIMEGRYGNERGGALLSFITEANPNFDITLYSDLSRAIESERTAYFFEQKKLIDYRNSHKNLIQMFPGTLLLAGRTLVEITIITSEKTEEAYSSGQENNVDLF